MALPHCAGQVLADPGIFLTCLIDNVVMRLLGLVISPPQDELSLYCVLRPGHVPVAWLTEAELESTTLSPSSSALSSSRHERHDISTAYVFVHDALNIDARKKVITGSQASRAFFYTLPPSKYEVAGQSEGTTAAILFMSLMRSSAQ